MRLHGVLLGGAEELVIEHQPVGFSGFELFAEIDIGGAVIEHHVSGHAQDFGAAVFHDGGGHFVSVDRPPAVGVETRIVQGVDGLVFKVAAPDEIGLGEFDGFGGTGFGSELADLHVVDQDAGVASQHGAVVVEFRKEAWL